MGSLVRIFKENYQKSAYLGSASIQFVELVQSLWKIYLSWGTLPALQSIQLPPKEGKLSAAEFQCGDTRGRLQDKVA